MVSEYDEKDPWEALMVEAFEQEAEAEGLEALEPSQRSFKRDPTQAVFVPGPDGLPVMVLMAERPGGGDSVDATLDPKSLPSAGRQFVADVPRALRPEPGPARYAAYGFEAMSAVLAAIEARDTTPSPFAAPWSTPCSTGAARFGPRRLLDHLGG